MTEFSSVFSLVPQNISEIIMFKKSVVDFGFCLILPVREIISESNKFSVEYSEAMVRDVDMNPCALES